MPGLLASQSSFEAFFNAIADFFASLAAINWLMLAAGLALFGCYLTCRARAYFNVIRAAYPNEPIQFRRIWGAYVAAFGFNNAIPARGGDIIRLFLTKSSVPRSSYPAVASSFLVELVFDLCIGVPILIFCFTQGVFPKPPDFSELPAFDLSFLASHPQLTVFLVTVVVILIVIAFALLASRVQAFWRKVSQGLIILKDRHRYFRQVFCVQLVAWLMRCSAIWFFLEAFHVGGSLRNVGLVLGVNVIASFVPLTPGGAGVQQALLIKVFAGMAAGATVAAYSVGQQIAIAVFSLLLGFAALVTIFGFRSFREVMQHARESHRAYKEEVAPEVS